MAVARRRRRDRHLPAGRRARARLGVRRVRAGPDRHRRACCRCACALVTLWCTGMIYASLPTIRAWHQPLVAPVYMVLALATGGVLLALLLAMFGHELRWAAGASVLALAFGAVLKRLLLDRDRRGGENPHRRGRHRAWPSRHGAAARSAAHPAELRDARDGLSGGAAPRRKASRHGRWLLLFLLPLVARCCC